MDTNLVQEQKEYTQAISRSAENLLSIINDVLDVSKIESGKMDLEQVEFDLHELVNEVFKGFELSLINPQVKLSLKGVRSWSHHFIGDPGRLRQVLTNLIGNALKFTSEGSVILELKELSEKANETKIHFEIHDSGIGIPQETLVRLFNAFSQADSSISRRYGGTGLGLSISKNLVSLMGGQISVKSEAGEGSCFHFYLNLKHGGPIQLYKTSRSSFLSTIDVKNNNKFRILVAEDNAINLKIALKQLEKLGYKADGAGGGNEAISALRNLYYDLVLMDIQMPDMDGYETTRRIRQSHTMEFRNIPIVAMTANALQGDKEKCLEQGLNDYISKPVELSKLAQTIEKYLKTKGDSIMSDHTQSPRALDPKKLADLRELDSPGEPSIIIELGTMYIDSFHQKFSNIKSAFQNKDIKKIKSIAHQLVSSSGNLGALQLSSLFRLLENSDFQSDQETEVIFNKIHQEFGNVEKELKQEIVATRS